MRLKQGAAVSEAFSSLLLAPGQASERVAALGFGLDRV
jgi:hypothetical protein